MHFDEILAGVDETGRGQVSADWRQGQTIFGGMTAALLYQALRRVEADSRILRSLTVQFIDPPRAGAPFELRVETFKQGRNVSMAQSRMVQDGAVKATALGCFGADRPSALRIEPLPAPALPGPGEGRPAFLETTVAPRFMNHFEFRWVLGDLPFRDGASRKLGGWMRLREPPRRLSEAHLIGLIDAWPPACLAMLDRPGPVSTVTWTLELFRPVSLPPDSWLLYVAEVEQASDGYSQASAAIWDPSGAMIARSHQTVAVYDRPRS
jgi:acyl-CoA thioesterase